MSESLEEKEQRENRLIGRAEHAQRLLGDELLVEALAGMRTAYRSAWERATRLEDREEMWRMLEACRRFEGHFRISVIRGQALSRARLGRERIARRIFGQRPAARR
jgi:hypothetical protein